MGQESSSGRLRSSVRREKDIDLDIDCGSVLKDYKEVERPQLKLARRYTMRSSRYRFNEVKSTLEIPYLVEDNFVRYP
ncbi:hypothetical protein V1478_010583 [Vespula squamosa]|uniref:Uncharacterized protein n=1 Tax=Vespula squamosa TaxID=30214 RepID=A0ABD2AI60_VESSQ